MYSYTEGSTSALSNLARSSVDDTSTLGQWTILISAGKIALMMCFNLLSTLVSLYMVTLSKKIIDHATVGDSFVALIVSIVF